MASNNDIVIGGNITYEASGDDVFGMIGKNNVYIGNFVPQHAHLARRLDRAERRVALVLLLAGDEDPDDASPARPPRNQRRLRQQLRPPAPTTTTRRCQYLPPPWFPALEDKYVVDLFREVAP